MGRRLDSQHVTGAEQENRVRHVVDKEDTDKPGEGNISMAAQEDAPARRMHNLGEREDDEAGEHPEPVRVGERGERIADIDSPGEQT